MEVRRRLSYVGVAAAALAAVFVCADPASADLLAAWNFNVYNGSDHFIAADHGTGTLTIDSAWSSEDLDAFGGTTNNAFGGDPDGRALTLINGDNNGLGIQFEISMLNLEDLVLTFATVRSNAGFGRDAPWDQLLYSSDGGGVFTALPGGTYDPGIDVYAVQTFDFSAITDLENNSQIVIRFVLDGASTIDPALNLIDNVQFNAVTIPAPGSLALLGVALIVLRRRRRHA